MSRANKGFLVTFEGTEGAGKSTLIREVASRLEAQGFELAVTREPGGSPVAEKIRKVILEEPMDPWTELFLYEAARAEHLAKTVLPALRAGKVVLCDRFTDSSLAYQSYARGLPWDRVKALNQAATQGLAPHLTVLVDVDPAVGLARASDRNRFEDEGLEFQKKVRRGFLKSMKEEPRRWFRIRSESGTPAQLAEAVVAEALRRIRGKTPRRGSPKKGARRG